MRQEINWRTRRPDRSSYEVRVARWGKELKFQFREKGGNQWDYERVPELHDWENLLDALERRYSRKQATDMELAHVKGMIAKLRAEQRAAQ
ncbi:hypothetical protein QPK87_08795 [Kamptonema cortianum]|uniref:Uncharacterized protein n=1 Tax=Geitlerinema calcuttense NRMC-F 0142 TaxID=2922238 RepID=A0ABT7LYK8_9CYAN|nr:MULTISPECIES: hypothetical protein [Cyanophyceae]MDK3156672.1 hypothetical protein [Kamptonema cortianum]MDL5050319.1 hypothetical protein [Oscillatoria amoena NRMC-F 0135]MDL5053409.1 hypothetical protein [Oscillatoria laete-virens NRMC-F 0139]MDL5056627.1 hypothetical protein [Geitlerinema calcuttense NRMC-F 0142]